MLTAAECKSFTCPPDKKRDRIYDDGGLYLQAEKTGGKYWRLKYTFGGVEKTYSIGVYKNFTLAEARTDRDNAKKLLSQGIDPTVEKQTKKLLKSQSYQSFGDCAKNYIASHPEWSASHLERVNAQLNNDVLTQIGKRPMKDIKGTEIFACINKIIERGSIESAHRTLGVISRIYETVILDGIIDATAGVKIRLPKIIHGKFAAITEPKQFAQLLRSIDDYQGAPEIKAALQIAPILFQRPKNVRYMRWSQLDLKGNLWTIPSDDIKRDKQEKKTGLDHFVPLPTQVVEILEKLKKTTGSGEFVFRSTRGKAGAPFSENTSGSALNGMGYKDIQTFHGFRASGRTMLDEVLNKDWRHLEAQLAHKVGDANGDSYNRTRFLSQRAEIIQDWANYLNKLKAGAEIIQLKAG